MFLKNYLTKEKLWGDIMLTELEMESFCIEKNSRYAHLLTAIATV